VLEKLRADWRRGRALKYIRLGEAFNYTWNTPTAGRILARVRFDAEDDTLVFKVLEINSEEVMGPKGPHRADVGLREIRTILDWIADMATDLGYTRLRVEGQRTNARRRYQRFEFDLAQYHRSHRPAG
jgi:hypothetical protein